RRASCGLRGVTGAWRVNIGLLWGASIPRGDHGEQALESCNTEAAPGRGCGCLTQARSSEGNKTFYPWVEPHDTDPPQTWLGRDPHEGKGEAIQWVRWIGHLHCIGWRCGWLEGGILLGLSATPRHGRSAPPPWRASAAATAWRSRCHWSVEAQPEAHASSHAAGKNCDRRGTAPVAAACRPPPCTAW